jgi:hypothetical protein
MNRPLGESFAPTPALTWTFWEWQQWKDETAAKTSDLRNLETWLKSLQDKPGNSALD